MKTVFIAGATGYLGRHLCAEFSRRGAYVIALVRDAARAGNLCADSLVEAEATRPETLDGVMAGADLAVSSLGITRQVGGQSYRDVDYQANLNLLREAEKSRVGRFGYVHVLNADRMSMVPLVAAKAAFVRELQASPITSTVIAPSGFFSDMEDFHTMAKSGRVWLFGAGTHRINPIHGADVAAAIYDSIDEGRDWLDVGGPDIFTHAELAALAFSALGQRPRISNLPDVFRRGALRILPWTTPQRIHGPAQFFLTAMGMDMVGEAYGAHHLVEYFKALALEGPAREPNRSSLQARR